MLGNHVENLQMLLVASLNLFHELCLQLRREIEKK